MRRIGDYYILVSLLWLILGMAFGIWMGIAGRLGFANSHAHLNLVGFVTSAIFGLICRQYPAIARSALAGLQFWVFEIGAVLLVIGKMSVDAKGSDMLVKIGSLVVIIGALLFLVMFALSRGDHQD